MTPASPFIRRYGAVAPEIGEPFEHVGPCAAIVGRVRVGRSAWLGARSVMRGDGERVSVGDHLRLGPRATVHIAHELFPAIVGDRVSIGANAVIHACTVGNDCVIGDDVVILDGSVIEDGVVIEAGSTVFQQSILKAGLLYAGSPAKLLRPIEAGEAEASADRLRMTADDPGRSGGARTVLGAEAFVAGTADIRGRVAAGRSVNIWFGCEVDGGTAEIDIGENTNIQDNSVLLALGSPITIGRDTTIGHNVRVEDSAIGDRVLIGIGSRLAAGTVVGDEVLLGAGSVTTPGQILEAGWFYGGRPARAIARMDSRKLALIGSTIGHYTHYARVFAESGAAR